jgi:plastocyanin domain-containing protein
VIGSLWNGKDSPPASMDAAGQNPIKVLRTRSGLQITLDDTPGSERLELNTPGGQAVSLQDSSGKIVISTGASKIIIADNQIEIESSGKLVIAAPLTEINTGMLSVNTGMAKFSGVVQTDTLIANSVVSASYTPGAGNIW